MSLPKFMCVLRTVEDACPYNFVLSKHPYENKPKGAVFLSYRKLRNYSPAVLHNRV